MIPGEREIERILLKVVLKHWRKCIVTDTKRHMIFRYQARVSTLNGCTVDNNNKFPTFFIVLNDLKNQNHSLIVKL